MQTRDDVALSDPNHSADAPNTLNAPGYAMIDAHAAYDRGRFPIQVSAVNLGGHRTVESSQSLGSLLVMPIQPRSASVTLRAKR